MTTLTVSLPRPHAAQRSIIAESRRFNVVNCGRRFGKSILGVDRIVRPAIDGYPVAWFAPTYKMLTDMWRILRRTLQPVTAQANDAEKRIELITGGVVDGWSLTDPNAARGRRYKRVGVDEAAMIRTLEEAWNAVIRPTLMDFEGDAWFLSTPKGSGTFYHSLWLRGQDAGYTEWMSWKKPTSANPYIRADEIEAARRETVELYFLQEYLAEFVDDGAGVFRGVMEAAVAETQERAMQDHVYVVGIDWGKHADFTVITTIDATAREMAHLERFNQIGYTTQLERLLTVLLRFRPLIVVLEVNSMGEAQYDALLRDLAGQQWAQMTAQAGCPGYQPRVFPFTTNQASKLLIIEALALAFQRSDLHILNEPVLIGELLAYAAERLPGGLLRYSAPHGRHDDCVMSLALAWAALADSTPQDQTVVYDERVLISPL